MSPTLGPSERPQQRGQAHSGTEPPGTLVVDVHNRDNDTLKGAMRKIDFSPPSLTEDDIAAVADVLRSGWITTGPISRTFEREIAAMCGTPEVVALNSCTAAMEIALRVLGVGPGDEVVVPAYTYTASAAVAGHVGARIKLVDSDEDDYAPRPDQIAAAVTDRTKAIMVVDLGGAPYPTPDLIAALEARGVGRPTSLLGDIGRPVVIVDAAHSLGATVGSAHTGALGDLTAFSFHAVKNLTTAEGGALTWRHGLPIGSEELARSVRRLALHGQTKDALAKHGPGDWEYDIVELGYKCNMPDVLAAFGLSQLRRYDQILAQRDELMKAYAEGLGDAVELRTGDTDTSRSSHHLAMVRLPAADGPRRDELIRGLAAQGVSANVHYKPLPLLTAYMKLGFDGRDYPRAVAHFRREITLPLHGLMTVDDAMYVAGVLRDLVGRE